MVVIRVPATTANLGPGFDTLGMALKLYNYVAMLETDNKLNIEVNGDGAFKIAKDETNLVYRSAQEVFRKVNYQPKGLKIQIENHIPIARGLGSSASVIVGGVLAANHISGNQLTTEQLLHLVTCIEGHPDNVAPAMLGGLVISAQQDDDLIYKKIKPPKDLTTVVAIPSYELSTKEARDALPKLIPIKDAVFNISRSGLLLWAFMNSDMELLSKVMVDKIHQPYRMPLIPGMDNVCKVAKKNGAFAVALSGAGPSVIAFCMEERVEEISRAMKETFQEAGVECTVQNLDSEISGAEIMTERGEQLWA